MKLVGYRHKESTDCLWLASNQDAADRMLKSWIERKGATIGWEFGRKDFEPITAELEYEESST